MPEKVLINMQEGIVNYQPLALPHEEPARAPYSITAPGLEPLASQLPSPRDTVAPRYGLLPRPEDTSGRVLAALMGKGRRRARTEARTLRTVALGEKLAAQIRGRKTTWRSRGFGSGADLLIWSGIVHVFMSVSDAAPGSRLSG